MTSSKESEVASWPDDTAFSGIVDPSKPISSSEPITDDVTDVCEISTLSPSSNRDGYVRRLSCNIDICFLPLENESQPDVNHNVNLSSCEIEIFSRYRPEFQSFLADQKHIVTVEFTPTLILSML